VGAQAPLLPCISLKRREKKEGEERKIERGKEGSLKWNRVSF
jgi:hypothetical protein